MKWKHEFYCETAVIKSTYVLHDQSHADAALECLLLYTIFSQLLNLSSKLMNVSKCYRTAHGKQEERYKERASWKVRVFIIFKDVLGNENTHRLYESSSNPKLQQMCIS